MQAPRTAVADLSAIRRVSGGDFLHDADEEGIAWRIVSGAVRLDRVAGGDRQFAGIALPGDVIGAETLIFGRYAFEARALGDCELEPWLAAEGQPTGERLLRLLAAAERRAADALALRCGEARERVQRLLGLLARDRRAGEAAMILIPGLRDMAEMTGLTVETVSRVVSGLRKAGLLQRRGRHAGLLLAHP